MEVRIGTTLKGRPARYDTASSRPLLLVGDVGRGKTTTARYIARWWLANTTRHAHVFTASPDEWGDLRCHPEGLGGLIAPAGRDCHAGSCLVVVDDLDPAADEAVHLLPLGSARVVLTSYGGNLDQLNQPGRVGDGFTAMGLVCRLPATAGEAAVLEWQGRLDWPSGTVAVVPDQRGPIDFPCHRWHAPAGEWAVAAR